ncbi:MAG: PLP-dependent aminotransferase family protein [Lachnospiraceae bacterium]
MDMMIRLDSHSGKKLYEQIYEYIKSEIREGKLLRDERLPSTRILARNLQVSRSTVDVAYEQLVSEGYIYALPGSGYYVSAIEDLFQTRDFKKERIASEVVLEKNYTIDFSTSAIDRNLFPLAIWKKLSKQVLVDDYEDLFRLGSSQGEKKLREVIARYLHASRGMEVLPEQLIVGAGNEYLLLLLDKLFQEKRTIALEVPTYKKAFQCFESFGYQVEKIKMDSQGIDVCKLSNTSADLAYVMPSHQFPTGCVMPISRRLELLKWANEGEKRYIIEDDHDSEFRYKGKPIPALRSIDTSDKVIYLGTFSKAIAPAIRISFMVLPIELLQVYQKDYRFFSSTVSRIDQNVLEVFISEGHFERHLNRMRMCYKTKHDFLMREIKALKKEFVITGEHAGTFLVLTSKKGIFEEELLQKAEKVGVKLYPLTQGFYGNKETDMDNSVLLGYGGLSLEEIKTGLQLLEKAFL